MSRRAAKQQANREIDAEMIAMPDDDQLDSFDDAMSRLAAEAAEQLALEQATDEAHSHDRCEQCTGIDWSD